MLRDANQELQIIDNCMFWHMKSHELKVELTKKNINMIQPCPSLQLLVIRPKETLRNFFIDERIFTACELKEFKYIFIRLSPTEDVATLASLINSLQDELSHSGKRVLTDADARFILERNNIEVDRVVSPRKRVPLEEAPIIYSDVVTCKDSAVHSPKLRKIADTSVSVIVSTATPNQPVKIISATSCKERRESDDEIIIVSEDGVKPVKQPPTPTAAASVGQVVKPFISSVFQSFVSLLPTPEPDAPPPFKLEYRSLTLTDEDIQALQPHAFLNDNIINFYLRYLYCEKFTPTQRDQTHIFNCFFYSRLTKSMRIKPVRDSADGKDCGSSADSIPPLPAFGLDQTSKSITTHLRNIRDVPDDLEERTKLYKPMAMWTRKVDVFTKDYVILPVNENSHWFLGLICYPWMAGMLSYESMFENQVFHLCELKPEYADVDQMDTGPDPEATLATLTSIVREEGDRPGEAFERWRRKRLACLRAKGVNAMPCVLIFDSLPASHRVPTLRLIRNYLQLEWCCRHEQADGRLLIDRDTVRGFSPRVPHQVNLYDCGLYLLHYVEMFYKEPLKNYTMAFFRDQIHHWFGADQINSKRAQLTNLLMKLEREQKAEHADSTS